MNDLILDSSSRRMLVDHQQFQQHENALSPFRHLVGAVWSNRWLATVIGVVIFGFIVGATILLPRTYYAQAMLIIHPGHPNLEQPTTTQQQELPPDTSAVDTEVEILRSPAIAQAVITKLELYKDPEFGGLTGQNNGLVHRVASFVSGLISGRQSPNAAPRPTADAMRGAVASFIAHSRIRRIGLTYMVQVGFVANSIQKAKMITNAIIDAYMQQKMDEKLAAVKRANEDLGTTLAGLREKALESEARVQEYINKYGLLGGGADTAQITAGELAEVNQKLADAEADTAGKMAAMAAAESRDEGGVDTQSQTAITGLREKEAEVSSTLAQLQTQFGPEYPLVKKTSAELQDIRNEINSETRRIVASLSADASAAERKEASLLSSRQQIENKIEANNQARVGLLPLQQAADSAKTIYETYLQRASEVTAERGLQQVDAVVESRAIAEADSPFSSLRFISMAAFVLAMIGSIVAVLFREMWTPRIRSISDVRRQTGLPVIGLLPDVLSSASEPVNCVAEKPLTVIAEAFHSLSAYLSLSPQTGHSKIIAVTSAVPGEGKTLTSICLARTLAATGARVLLLDCDLRNPCAPRFFAKQRFGVAEIIKHSIPIDKAIVRDEKSGIWFLSGTGGNDIPVFLFSDNRIDSLLATLSEQFDHIIIDTPPVLGFADARILASKANRVLFMVKWNKTPAAVVSAAMEVLRLCNARVMGVVLNKVDVRQQAVYGFADGSDYYHHYATAYPTVT